MVGVTSGLRRDGRCRSIDSRVLSFRLYGFIPLNRLPPAYSSLSAGRSHRVTLGVVLAPGLLRVLVVLGRLVLVSPLVDHAS